MADKLITVGFVDENDFYKVDSGVVNPNIKRQGDAHTVTYTHVGDGAYQNDDDIPDGIYDFYSGTTKLVKILGVNGEWIGDDSLDYLPLGGDGHWDGQGKRLHDIDDPVSGIDVGDRDYNDGRYIKKSGDTMSGDLNLNGNQLINPGDPTDDSHVGDKLYNDTRYPIRTGNNDFTGLNRFLIDTGATKYPKIYYDDEVGGGNVYVAPTHPLHIATKQYADNLVSGITVPAVPYSGTEVIVIGNITQVSGKIYPSILSAANHLDTLGLSASKRGVMYVRNHPQINYYVAALNSFKTFINIIGYAPALLTSEDNPDDWDNLGTVIVVYPKDVTAKQTISNCTLIFGDKTSGTGHSNNQTGARAYNGYVYNNCVILAYNDTTFNNCVLNNCIILHDGAFKATCNNTRVINCAFNNEPVIGDTNLVKIYTAGFTWNLPNDITGWVPEE